MALDDLEAGGAGTAQLANFVNEVFDAQQTTPLVTAIVTGMTISLASPARRLVAD